MQRVTYVVLLDVALRPISAAQSERRRLYLIQRLLVAVLWSSKIGGRMLSERVGSQDFPPTRRVIFVGQEGASVEVDHRFVQHLSANGRAAPTERNVLTHLVYDSLADVTPGVRHHNEVPRLDQDNAKVLRLDANDRSVPSLSQALATMCRAMPAVVILDLAREGSSSSSRELGMASPYDCTISPEGARLSAFAELAAANFQLGDPLAAGGVRARHD
jgi:hypothetical protein